MYYSVEGAVDSSNYSSPELQKMNYYSGDPPRHNYDGQTDIWSAGCLLYQLFSDNLELP